MALKDVTRPAATGVRSDAALSGARLRFVTAASLFDGHDVAINVMRRLIQAAGAEVIHLGHNRSVEDVVRAALQEDADAIAVSSYQGGHLEYFQYMVDMLAERGAAHVRVFAGGGGTITPAEIAALEAYGVERLYHPNDGLRLGLVAMIDDVIARTRRAAISFDGNARTAGKPTSVPVSDEMAIGLMLSRLEDRHYSEDARVLLRQEWQRSGSTAPVVGITGTGGAGKSTVVDELVRRFLEYLPDRKIAVLAVDPTRRLSGGALLGDRIRLNTLRSRNVFMRSMATRRQDLATSESLKDCIGFLKSAGFELVIVETAGIGQGDSEIVDLVDLAVYVMTSEYGAPSQLEKIDMLDFADMVVLNKADRRGVEDALRDVRKQWKRNHLAFKLPSEQVPVFPTIASQFRDPGITWAFAELCRLLRDKLKLPVDRWSPAVDTTLKEPRATALIPEGRLVYLAEIAEQGRRLNSRIELEVEAAVRAQSFWMALGEIDPVRPAALDSYDAIEPRTPADPGLATLRQRYEEAVKTLSTESIALLRAWPDRLKGITDEHYAYEVRGLSIQGDNYVTSLSHQPIPKIAAPTHRSWGELLRFLLKENLPGAYPYTAGVYPYRRGSESPARMFAGEGTPERTNRRFHYLSADQSAIRLSTAFDSVTLYGEDPHPRLDIFGKIGNSGVSIATLDDMKKLYSGFDLSSPTTSVSMTINGPAPIILAMFMNTAVDQAVERFLRSDSQRWLAAQAKIDAVRGHGGEPQYAGSLPSGNDGLGLALLSVSGDEVIDRETYDRIKTDTLARVRGTVQADILKEDQAQNTCIFSTDFALRMMGDIQEFFIVHGVRNFYSVSISGYHIAEAGANPISQLAFTLANGFTLVEYYLARRMRIDDFAPQLSFFFSNGMDAEYSVIGRVARRVWARAMRERYGATARSQMLKYHIQTSGRSLHAQEIQFNDIRTTLQALCALFDNCNSLHTNAYDEAITTPTEESVRRAVAIQLIINSELGVNACENPWQGSFLIERLTDLVEEAVYREFEAISERGGVLRAMDTMYQRGKIQDESLSYEQKKHDGSLPLIGVNTFLSRGHRSETATTVELIRSTDDEKRQQILNTEAFRSARQRALAARSREAGNSIASLGELRRTAEERRNTFASLMEAVKYHSLGQITGALYDVGGEYRRNM